MESGSSCKKRKMDGQEVKEEEEEAQMEQFYALIKSIRETRDQLIIKKKSNNNKKIAAWKPTFELQDFVQEEAQRQDTTSTRVTMALPAAAADEKDQTGKGIDLTLSL
ncbi:hypothetical protein L6164_034819 [Bauhinia variegata]|uniref:Uncharacterized protein n=1 Tax=Bauhinia variegata TaxID=167791 RepID=A0ACB9KW96_BAUVA|nr:hypothetical protein L6164_034819 [Bauhinia variegata]